MQSPVFRVCLAAVALTVGAHAAALDESRTTPDRTRVADRVIALEVVAPDGAWSLRIEEIWREQNELWVFARVSRPDDALAVQMLTKLNDKIVARLPDLPVKFFVLGKTWEWKNKEKVTWITERSDEYRTRRRGDRLWRK